MEDNKKVCQACFGVKKIDVGTFDPWGNRKSDFRKCANCNGTGIQPKKKEG